MMTRIRNDKCTIRFYCYSNDTLFLRKYSLVFVAFVLVFVLLVFELDLVIDSDRSKNLHLKENH